MPVTNTHIPKQTLSEQPLLDQIQSTAASTQEAIRSFVFDQYPLCRQKSLQDSDSLIESGIVDSMGILELVAFVESAFNIRVEDIDLTPENFDSIESLSSFVAVKIAELPTNSK